MLLRPVGRRKNLFREGFDDCLREALLVLATSSDCMLLVLHQSGCSHTVFYCTLQHTGCLCQQTITAASVFLSYQHSTLKNQAFCSLRKQAMPESLGGWFLRLLALSDCPWYPQPLTDEPINRSVLVGIKVLARCVPQPIAELKQCSCCTLGTTAHCMTQPLQRAMQPYFHALNIRGTLNCRFW